MKKPLFAAFAGVVVASAAAQGTPTARIGEPLPPPASLEALGGYNFGNWMPVALFGKYLHLAEPRSLRFPGGNVGDENDLGEGALKGLKAGASILGAGELIVQTRVFASRPDAKNAPDDAAEAARIAKELGLKIAYWEVGNEPDLYASNRGDRTWTAEKYCQTFRAQRDAILKVDPQAKFAGPAISGSTAAWPFLEAFVKGCGDIVDLLTWHIYPDDGTMSDEAALATAARGDGDAKYFTALLKDPAKNPLGYGREIALGVTEYSLSWKTDRYRHLTDMPNALWSAEVTLRLAESGAKVASYFALQATGGHGLLDTGGYPRPTYYAFQQLANYKGQPLAVQNDDPALWVHAARDGKLTTVLVSNTATADKSFSLDLPGWRAIGAKSFTEQTVKDEADFIRLPVAPNVPLPARSLTRIVLKQEVSQ